MSEAIELVEDIEAEGESLDDLQQEWQNENDKARAIEDQPSDEEKKRAAVLAARINGGFLFLVSRTQCPHVDISELVDREQGDSAFLPLAEKWGGEVPPWFAAFEPYIAAGIYMGTTIVTARQVEAQVIEQAASGKGGGNGEESEH